jgi:hypothetical protein
MKLTPFHVRLKLVKMKIAKHVFLIGYNNKERIAVCAFATKPAKRPGAAVRFRPTSAEGISPLCGMAIRIIPAVAAAIGRFASFDAIFKRQGAFPTTGFSRGLAHFHHRCLILLFAPFGYTTRHFRDSNP